MSSTPAYRYIEVSVYDTNHLTRTGSSAYRFPIEDDVDVASVVVGLYQEALEKHLDSRELPDWGDGDVIQVRRDVFSPWITYQRLLPSSSYPSWTKDPHDDRDSLIADVLTDDFVNDKWNQGNVHLVVRFGEIVGGARR